MPLDAIPAGCAGRHPGPGPLVLRRDGRAHAGPRRPLQRGRRGRADLPARAATSRCSWPARAAGCRCPGAGATRSRRSSPTTSVMFTPERVRRACPGGKLDFKARRRALAAGRDRPRLLRHRAAQPRRGRGRRGVHRRGGRGRRARRAGRLRARGALRRRRPAAGRPRRARAAVRRPWLRRPAPPSSARWSPTLRRDLEHAEAGQRRLAAQGGAGRAARHPLGDPRAGRFLGPDARLARNRLHRLVQPAHRLPGRRAAADSAPADAGPDPRRRAAHRRARRRASSPTRGATGSSSPRRRWPARRSRSTR